MLYLDKTPQSNYLSMVWTTFYSPDHHTPWWQNDILPEMSKQIFIHALYYILQASPLHHSTPNGNRIKTLQNVPIMAAFYFSCGSPCKMLKWLDNHLKSCPVYLDQLVKSRAFNWAAMLGLSSAASSSKGINHHLFQVKTDKKTSCQASSWGHLAWLKCPWCRILYAWLSFKIPKTFLCRLH